ncbi:MAG: trehalose-phosphatase [Rhizomicrobium sp.]
MTRAYTGRGDLPDAPLPESVSTGHDAFLLDVDGTLLDIADTPEGVVVPDALKRSLSRLQEQTAGATALVSGRRIADLDDLFAPLRLAAIGCHGAEWRRTPEVGIALRAPPLSARIGNALRAAVAELNGFRVEEKLYTLAFHYRQTPGIGPELERRLRGAAQAFPELRFLHGKMVLEVKSGRFDKGESVGALMEFEPFAGRRPVFLGDDITDEDAFAEVHGLRGLGISVGRVIPEAVLMLASPQAARQWLAEVVGNSD